MHGKRCTRCCGTYADNFRFQSRHNIFYYIRSAAASFHVRRRYKVCRMSMSIMTQNHSVNCEALVHCNSLITSDSKYITTSGYNYFRFKRRVIFYVSLDLVISLKLV